MFGRFFGGVEKMGMKQPRPLVSSYQVEVLGMWLSPQSFRSQHKCVVGVLPGTVKRDLLCTSKTSVTVYVSGVFCS